MGMNYLVKTTLACVVLFSSSIYAQDEETADNNGWTGVGELGFVSTSGNTDTETLNLKLEFIKEMEQWRHRFTAAALTASKNGTNDAKRYSAEFQGDRKLSEKSYVFGALRWDVDKFGAYDPMQTITAGYGNQLLKSDTHELKAEIGLGYRKMEDATTGISSNDAIARLLLDDIWAITPTTAWTNRLLVESGSDNTFTQFNTGLAVSMSERFALKFGFELRNNSDIPATVLDKTDTTTTMNLVYHF
jgi:putative salt-induced outer membrane protein